MAISKLNEPQRCSVEGCPQPAFFMYDSCAEGDPMCFEFPQPYCNTHIGEAKVTASLSNNIAKISRAVDIFVKHSQDVYRPDRWETSKASELSQTMANELLNFAASHGPSESGPKLIIDSYQVEAKKNPQGQWVDTGSYWIIKDDSLLKDPNVGASWQKEIAKWNTKLRAAIQKALNENTPKSQNLQNYSVASGSQNVSPGVNLYW